MLKFDSSDSKLETPEKSFNLLLFNSKITQYSPIIMNLT